MKYYFCILCLLLVPLFGRAQILISEVAWMGTDESHTNEWIEIYNFSSSPTDLTGWTITSADGKISISLKCTLAPHGVAVLERTDENTLPDITALLTYTGELVNSGTTLTVKDPSGNISNEVDSGGDNWLNIGGTNTAPKQTPQQTPSGWITAPPTPMGQATAGDAGTSNVTCPPPEEANEEEDNNTVATVTEKSGGGGGSAKRSSSSAPKENIPPKLALTIDGLKTAYVNQDVTFAVVPSGVGKTLESSLSYDWNLGDTYTEKGKNISHVFSYPGEYIVVVAGSFAKQSAVARHEVTVLPVLLELGRTPQGDVQLRNTAKHEVDLGGFVVHGDKSFTFPKYTFVKAGGTLIVPKDRVGAHASNIALLDTQKVAVASSGEKVSVPKQTALTQRSVRQEYPTAPIKNLEQQEAPITASVEVQESESAVIQIGNREVEEKGVLAQFFNRVRGFFGL